MAESKMCKKGKKGQHNKGKTKENYEPLKRVSEKMKGNTNSVGRIGYWATHPRSEETKQKISLAMKGEKHPLFGKPCSEERKQRISRALKGLLAKEKHPMWGKKQSTKCHEKRPAQTERMKNGGATLALSFIKNPSKPQLALYKHIKTIYPTVKLNFPIRITPQKHFSLDVAVPELKIDYEYDEPYWHSGDRKIKDFFRDEALIEQGWCVVRIKRGELDAIRN
jgi:very-short-patch-repair endonuclease